jgi:ubiquinone biosynthesis protein
VTEHFQLELQPQMLLLQKTMLQAEGVGRRLDSSVNMWELSRPLMERWMTDQFGPRARIRDSLGDIVDTLERLPRMVRETERTVAALRQGVRLHPDSERAINKGRKGRGIFPNWMPWVLAAALAYLMYSRR